MAKLVDCSVQVLALFIAETQSKFTEEAEILGKTSLPSGDIPHEWYVENYPYVLVAMRNKHMRYLENHPIKVEYHDLSGTPEHIRGNYLIWSFKKRDNANLLFFLLAQTIRIPCWLMKRKLV